ncbi:hypothetical protein [Kordiimonas aquimaris]|uniref:hypothetical protein n=1 Tax=Kordiimonas aquimaris TaxID=707591 RepID=UPI0021D19BC6|nr:hypothetical protein [Kordiimonas aquimaris]
MIAGIGTAAPDSDAMQKMLAGLAEPLTSASAALANVAEKLAAVMGGTGGAGKTGPRVFVPSVPEPAVSDNFAGFLEDTFAGSSLFEVSPPKKSGSEADNANAAEKIKALSTETADNQAAKDEEQILSDKKVWASKLANAIAGSKKLAKVKKAYAVSAAIVNTAKGVTETFSRLGFPAAIPFAAALAAQGAQQIATIRGQAHNGLNRVPSTGTYLLERGERVVGKRLNQDLSGFLAGMSGEGGSVSNNLDRSISKSSTFNPTINMTIGSNASPDAVFANRGALEGMIREIYADYAQEAPF